CEYLKRSSQSLEERRQKVNWLESGMKNLRHGPSGRRFKRPRKSVLCSSRGNEAQFSLRFRSEPRYLCCSDDRMSKGLRYMGSFSIHIQRVERLTRDHEKAISFFTSEA